MNNVAELSSNQQRFSDPDLDTQTVMLVITEACNLQCVYCYEKNKTPRSMSEKSIKDIINKHMTQAKFANISFDFFGGEPLIEFDKIKNVIEWFHSKKWSKGHRFTISTNGTLFTEDMKNFLAEWKDCVIPMVSLDGTKKAHDLNRCNSYDLVEKHIPFLRDNWPTQPVRMTIGPDTINQVAEGIINIHSLGLSAEAGLVFEDVWGNEEDRLRYLKIYERELARLVDFYAANPSLSVPFILSRDVRALLIDAEPGKRYCGAGKYMVCYTPDGTGYPCHRFAPISSTRPCSEPYSELPIYIPKQQRCDDCVLLPICPSCQGFNWEINHHVDIKTTYHCDFFKLEVIASAKLLLRRIDMRLQEKDLNDESIIDLSRQILGINKLMSSDIYKFLGTYSLS